MGSENSHADPISGLRVTFVFETLEMGGAERQALLFARYLKDERGAAVEVLGLRAPGMVSEMCEQCGIPWRIVPGFYWGRRRSFPAAIYRFTRQLRRTRPDVVLPYTMMPNVLSGLAWRWAGARLCIWNQRDEGRQRQIPFLEQRALRQTPRFVALSQVGASFLTDTLNVDCKLVQIVYNGIQLAAPERDGAAWRAELGLDEKCFVAAMVANLHGFKDHPTLVRAWQIVANVLASQGRNAVLLLAGHDYGIGDGLRRLAGELGISDRIRFLGLVKDVAGLMQACDIGVHSSPTEGLCNAVLEFMASGRPIVATDIPALREAVGPAGYELLAAQGDHRAMSDRILRLAASPEMRQRFGEMGRRRIEEEFNPRRMCERMCSIILDALGG